MTKRISILLLALLLAGGYAGTTLAQVTYHILTLPFSTLNNEGSANYRTDIRVEALRCVSNETTVGLPAAFKSPLLKDAAYTYYQSATETPNVQIYANNGTKYTTYVPGTEIAAGTDVGALTDIYVTYTYDPLGHPELLTELGQQLKLDGSVKYAINIGGNRILARNCSWGNRPAAVTDGTADFSRIKQQIANEEPTYFNPKLDTPNANYSFGSAFFLWWLKGEDPYNITLASAYEGSATYQEGQRKTYANSSIFNNINADLWCSAEVDNDFGRNPTTRKGWYRNIGDVVNSFAILGNSSHIMVGTKVNTNNSNRQPTNTGLYYTLEPGTGNIPQLQARSLSATGTQPSSIDIGMLRKYRFKLKTSISNSTLQADIKQSDLFKDEPLVTLVPDNLKRKFVTFTGAFADEAKSQPITTPEEAITKCVQEDGCYVVWLDYETTLSFETYKGNSEPTYDDLTWYNFYMNGETQYVAWLAGGTVHTNKNHSRYGRDAQFAFVGDPYEMKVVSRKATDDAGGTLQYITIDDEEPSKNVSFTSTGTCMEILWDDGSNSKYTGALRFLKFGEIMSGYNEKTYLHWKYGQDGTYPLNGQRDNRMDQICVIRVFEVPKKSYTYHIMRGDKTIAVKATVSQEVSTRLDYAHIPSIIRSPFLALPGVELYFFDTEADAKADNYKAISIRYAPDDGKNDLQHIWVRYDMSECTSPLLAAIDGSTSYNVRLNGEYIYIDTEGIVIKSTPSPVNTDAYKWILGGGDPYAMTIKNVAKNQYFDCSKTDGSISWVDSNPGVPFIVKQGRYAGVYEVMAATGEDLDASETYYNIGRSDGGNVLMYDNTVYQTGYDQLRFLLTPVTASKRTYHLIDHEGKDLLRVEAQHENTDKPQFPTDYWSPLVDTYYYYIEDNFNKVGEVYTLKDGVTELATVGTNANIYVRYKTSNRVDMVNKHVMYLLKYAMGTPFYAENGADARETEKITPIYPYCNGDNNFYIYGQDQYDLQQQSAASTRTRWAWYLESANNDPYHVRICSRQTSPYNDEDLSAYFLTYKPYDYGEVVTNLTWPGITGTLGTEYMILGSVGQYRLLTTYGIDLNNDGDRADEGEDVRKTVNSFEQYWKTYDAIKNNLLGKEKNILDEADKGANPNGSILVPTTPAKYREALTGDPEEGGFGFHSYEKWAYAKRWNGYNSEGKTSKGWEELEHWFETVQMGEGYFDLIPVTIDPALILLDQHGWEIMRKPLPSSPNDPVKDAKYEAIRAYDSPMVKEYHFWTKASKRAAFHQYYNLGQRVTIDGEPYTSQSLTDLPPYDAAANIKDAKGNVYDQYVTYTVKDEYVKSYNAETGEGLPFLVRQGDVYASNEGTATAGTTAIANPGGMSQTIIEKNGTFDDKYLWFVKPNADIDTEMGYDSDDHDWTNDYDDPAKVKTEGFNSNAFDPYNIQISSKANADVFFITQSNGSSLVEGAPAGTYTDDDHSVTLGNLSTTARGEGHDSQTLYMTNATLMAVQDAEGNMQLMPRFDQQRRVRNFSSLVTRYELTDVDVHETYTYLYHPYVYNYIIIDNQGREALRYQGGGELTPQTPEHFKSQLAKDFTYHKTLTATDAMTYDLSTLADEITESLAGAGLTTEGPTGNKVYVRYVYDADADIVNHVLQGKWLTMQLNGKDVVYSGGMKQGSGRPSVINGDDPMWQWKLLATPQSEPDPYAVSLYSRRQNGVATEVNAQSRFALLNHNNVGEYALAVAGTGRYTYDFVYDEGMNTETAAITAPEAGVTSTSCTFNGTKSQVVFTDDVEHNFNYRIYTNGGVFAIKHEQTYSEVLANDFVPTLPEPIRSPLLNSDQFLYYEREIDMGDNTKELTNLYGLWEDEVYVRYRPYDRLASQYEVPNERNATGTGQVAPAPTSNDAALDLSNTLLYNIIWYNDNMMTEGGSSITDGGSRPLASDNAHEWLFEGDDPYAIKLHSRQGGGKYVKQTNETTCALANDATTFMLLPHDGYAYGVLRVTGSNKMLTGYGNELTIDDPNQFIIFALATHTLTYHLAIANIGETTTLYYPDYAHTVEIEGTTQRDLTNYPIADYNAGHVSLGDPLHVPPTMYRPNVVFKFYVGDIYDVDEEHGTETLNSALTEAYKGHEVTAMGTDEALLGTHVYVNIVYTFNGSLETNAGEGFVTHPSQKKWYTVETSDETPQLAQYTNAWGLELKEGRQSRYTNDYLWSPVGDPYGFKMYNRYIYRTNNQPTLVMSTAAAPAEGAQLTMQAPDANGYDVYELLAGSQEGFFYMHPVVNQGGTQLYLGIVTGTDHDGDGVDNTYLKLSTEPCDLTFGLSTELLEPYYIRAGYVGGLNSEGVQMYEAAGDNLIQKQMVVYDDAYIVKYEPGYYRLHSQPDIAGLTQRYLSGYTHKRELDPDKDVNTADALPMHFYERNGVTTNFETLETGFTKTAVTRGQIPILAPEADPASIFYFSGPEVGINEIPHSTMQTQGLYVKENKMAESAPTEFHIMDVGGAVMLIHNGAVPAERKYLCFDQKKANIYDIDYLHDVHTDYAKWCMEPANKQGLVVTMHSGGDAHKYSTTYYYSTLHVPFNVRLPADADGKVYTAYTCVEADSPWPTATSDFLHPKPIGNYNTGSYVGSNKFVPAGTPVLLATTDNAGTMRLIVPSSAPLEPIETIFPDGEYLEQLLTTDKIIYTFGLPFTSEMSMDDDDPGTIHATLPEQSVTDAGFYINANPNKELGLSKSTWVRNNRYVLANRIYYEAAVAPARQQARNFVRVVFDDLEGELQPDGTPSPVGDGNVYDLQGRRVLTAEELSDPAWQQRLKPGIYIRNGRKFKPHPQPLPRGGGE